MTEKIKKTMKEFSDFLGICYGGILGDNAMEDICSTLKALIEVNILPEKKFEKVKNKIINVVLNKDSLIEIHGTHREVQEEKIEVPIRTGVELDKLFGKSGGYFS